jgi:hypothetical protein
MEEVAPGYAVGGRKYHQYYHHPANNQQETAQAIDYIVGGIFILVFQIHHLDVLITPSILPAR